MAGNGEVVHRRTDDDGIGSEKLFQGAFGQLGLVLLHGVTQLGRGAGGYQGGSGKVAQRIAGQVAVGYLGIWIDCAPGLDHRTAELTGSGSIAEDAGIEVQ